MSNVPEQQELEAARTELKGRLDLVPQLVELPGIEIQSGSRMADDRAATSDLDLPFLCAHYQGASSDYLRGLHALMRPDNETLVVPRFAAYPLIRAALEASAQVVWILSPGDQRQRFLRLLKLQKDELDYDAKYMRARTADRANDTAEIRSEKAKLVADFATKRQIRWGRLLDAATTLGIQQSEFEHGSRNYEALIQEATEEQGLDSRFFAGTWQFISGLAHPSFSRAWSGSINEPRNSGSDGTLVPEGTVLVWSEANPTILRDGVGVAVKLHIRAAQLIKDACAAADRAGDGDSG